MPANWLKNGCVAPGDGLLVRGASKLPRLCGFAPLCEAFSSQNPINLARFTPNPSSHPPLKPPPVPRPRRWCRLRRYPHPARSTLLIVLPHRRGPEHMHRRPHLHRLVKQLCLRRRHPHAAVRRRVTRQNPRVHPRRAVKSHEPFHRRRHELAPLRHRHRRVRAGFHNLSGALLHDLPVQVRKMIQILLDHRKVSRRRLMPLAPARDRRLRKLTPVLQQISPLFLEIDLDRVR